MFEIEKTQNIGKIYQITGNLSACRYGNAYIIQTFGKSIEGSVKCTSKTELMEILANIKNMECLVYTISSFTVDYQLYSCMRMSNCRGVNLFLYTIEPYRAWYADALL